MDINNKDLNINNNAQFYAKYDENGNLIHYKEINGAEWWKEYDEKGKEIHYKDNTGFEYWYEYDENGHLIHKDTDGSNRWKECIGEEYL